MLNTNDMPGPNQVDSTAPKTKKKKKREREREKAMVILVDKKAVDKVQYNLWGKKKTFSRVGKKHSPQSDKGCI